MSTLEVDYRQMDSLALQARTGLVNSSRVNNTYGPFFSLRRRKRNIYTEDLITGIERHFLDAVQLKFHQEHRANCASRQRITRGRSTEVSRRSPTAESMQAVEISRWLDCNRARHDRTDTRRVRTNIDTAEARSQTYQWMNCVSSRFSKRSKRRKSRSWNSSIRKIPMCQICSKI